MERTERLLDLVALLLDSHDPVSWAELQEHFPADYAGSSVEANERKFERDKAELLELGIPLVYLQGDDELPDGYLVERSDYYLPDVGFEREELATLYAAGSAALASGAFPGQQDLRHALRKIAFFHQDEATAPAARVRLELGPTAQAQDFPEKLEQLWGAVASRKLVNLVYASPRAGGTPTERRVDAYGLALRRGMWSLVGYCHLRKGLRTFHVHRIQSLTVNTSKPRSADYEIPADFKLDDFVASYPWQHRIHAPLEVEVELSPELVPLASNLFPDARPSATPGSREGAKRLTVRATYLDGLVRHVLALAPQVKVRAPEEAVQRMAQMLERVLALHQAPPPSAEEAPEAKP